MSEHTHCGICSELFKEGEKTRFLCGPWVHEDCLEEQGEEK